MADSARGCRRRFLQVTGLGGPPASLFEAVGSGIVENSCGLALRNGRVSGEQLREALLR